jgi:hypothetical protein
MRHLLRYVGLILIAGLTSTANAQVDTGGISGKVSDQSGSVIVNAVVTVDYPSSGLSLVTLTNKEGLYTVVNLRVGVYKVSVHAPGFETVSKVGINVHLQDRLAIDFALKVGQASTSVEVADAAPLLETQTSLLGQVLDGIDNKNKIVDFYSSDAESIEPILSSTALQGFLTAARRNAPLKTGFTIF